MEMTSRELIFKYVKEKTGLTLSVPIHRSFMNTKNFFDLYPCCNECLVQARCLEYDRREPALKLTEKTVCISIKKPCFEFAKMILQETKKLSTLSEEERNKYYDRT